MKHLVLLILSLGLSLNSFAQHAEWLVNLEEAKLQSEESDKFILLNFSGSDWCGNCMRLEKELFVSEEFLAFAEENLILLNLDFPAKKANKLSPEQTAYNDRLAERYNKKGVFPLTLILNSKGEIIGEMAYPNALVSGYIKNIQSQIE